MQREEVVLKVEGMTCTNCAAGISKALHSEGFTDAVASFTEGEVSFTPVNGLEREKAIDRIEQLGYKVREETADGPKGLSGLEKKFLWCLAFTLPLFMHMFVPHDWLLNNPWVQLGLCTPVYAIGFLHFGRSALGSLRARYANMDVLIFSGSTAAFLYSVAGMWLYLGTHEVHNYLFFETTATIITLVLLGNVIEFRSVQQMGRNLGDLGKLQPTLARVVLRAGSREKIFETHPSTLRPGDLIQVNEGDNVPADGTVVNGKALADESAITGESLPVEKTIGSKLFSGTTLLSGNVRAETTSASKDSTLEQIIELVRKARRDQPEIQKLGDRVSSIFVPAVMLIAASTFAVTWLWLGLDLTTSLMNAIAVLVISCPCAMGLATPTAVVAGVGRAARMGVLIKGGSTLEAFARSRTVVFDKTGTLTTGAFVPKFVYNTIGTRAKSIIKALESHSSHPIARSLVQHFEGIEAEVLINIREVSGHGMEAALADGTPVYFGRADAARPEADLELRLNQEVVATVRIADALKPGAKEMTETLRGDGFRLILLSGDRTEKVEAVAKALKIKEWHAGVSPSGKLEFIEALAAKEPLVMVGDGINDGPALSRAQVGIAPGSASALASDAARVVLMHPDHMQALTSAWKVSKHTYRTIRQNLFWAFFYNVVAIPIAAAGYLNPMIAALAMAFSDIIVIGNSIRLKYKKLR